MSASTVSSSSVRLSTSAARQAAEGRDADAAVLHAKAEHEKVKAIPLDHG